MKKSVQSKVVESLDSQKWKERYRRKNRKTEKGRTGQFYNQKLNGKRRTNCQGPFLMIFENHQFGIRDQRLDGPTLVLISHAQSATFQRRYCTLRTEARTDPSKKGIRLSVLTTVRPRKVKKLLYTTNLTKHGGSGLNHRNKVSIQAHDRKKPKNYNWKPKTKIENRQPSRRHRPSRRKGEFDCRHQKQQPFGQV